MKRENVKVGIHVWIRETDCCGSEHKKGEEGIIVHIDDDMCFQVESVIRKIEGWHEWSCVCESCGYTQGHPIIYCPKCPGKMHRMTYSEYKYFIGYSNEKKKSSIWYKQRCSSLLGLNRITMNEWHKIVEIVEKI